MYIITQSTQPSGTRASAAGVRANRDFATSNGVTALFLASQNGHLEVLRLLLESRADKGKAIRNYGETVLILASENGHLEVVRLLLEFGADEDLANSGGTAALKVASANGHLKLRVCCYSSGLTKTWPRTLARRLFSWHLKMAIWNSCVCC